MNGGFIMNEFEKVERLREHAGVTFEEAREALIHNDWALLDAMVELERQGKVQKPDNTSFTTQYEKPETIEEAAAHTGKNGGVGSMLHKFAKWVQELIKKGCENSFEVVRGGETLISMPVILAVMLAVFLFWPVLIALVIGLFCNCRYRFVGTASMKVDINKAMDSVADTADDIKNSFQKK